MSRSSVNKGAAARGFRGDTMHSKRINVAPRPMRGGIRL